MEAEIKRCIGVRYHKGVREEIEWPQWVVSVGGREVANIGQHKNAHLAFKVDVSEAERQAAEDACRAHPEISLGSVHELPPATTEEILQEEQDEDE